jgi:hypothetical protein
LRADAALLAALVAQRKPNCLPKPHLLAKARAI